MPVKGRTPKQLWTVHPPSKRGHRACPSLEARAGLSCGTRGIRLRLLPSGPDLIRVPTSRRTRPSTPPRRTDPDGQSLGTVVGPAKRISGHKAPLTPRLARSAGDPTLPTIG